MKHIIDAWTDKYKKSIDCSNPKGFSQKAHCAGRKKKLDEYRGNPYTTERGGKRGPRMSRQRKNRAGVLDQLAMNGIQVSNQPADVTIKGGSDTFVVAKKDVKKAEKVLDDYFNKEYVRRHMAKNQLRRDTYKIVAEDVNEDAQWKDKNDEREHNKLFMQSMRALAGSPKQKKIIQQMNVLRRKNGLDLLREKKEMDPRKHVARSKRNPDMFCVFDSKGREVKLFKKKSDAEAYAIKNHDSLMVEKVYADSGLGKWFGSGSKGGAGGGGWDRYNTKGERIGKCGDGKESEGKPKCLSKAKAAKLRAQGGKKAIANAVRRKKAKDPQVDRPGTGNKPINVSNRIKKSESVNTYLDRVRERRDKSSYTS
jgi:hypothetical protein